MSDELDTFDDTALDDMSDWPWPVRDLVARVKELEAELEQERRPRCPKCGQSVSDPGPHLVAAPTSTSGTMTWCRHVPLREGQHE